MRPVPPPFDQEPGPDDLDSRIALVLTWFDTKEEIRSEVFETVSSAIAAVPVVQDGLIPGVAAEPRLSGYHVGPMAQGFTVQMLCTVYENIRPVLTDAATLIAIGQFTRVAVRMCRARIRTLLSDRPPDPDGYRPGPSFSDPIITEPMILGLCFQHYRESYGTATQRVSLDTRVRSLFTGITDAGHPGGYETWVVRVWTGQTSFVYVVDSYGKPMEHFKIRGGDLVSLPLPDWYAELVPHEADPGVLRSRLDVRNNDARGRDS